VTTNNDDFDFNNNNNQKKEIDNELRKNLDLLDNFSISNTNEPTSKKNSMNNDIDFGFNTFNNNNNNNNSMGTNMNAMNMG